jgi:hypothetical protein
MALSTYAGFSVDGVALQRLTMTPRSLYASIGYAVSHDFVLTI